MEATEVSSRARLSYEKPTRSVLLIVIGVFQLLLSLGMFGVAAMIGRLLPDIPFFWGFIGCSLIYFMEAVFTISGGCETTKNEKALRISAMLSILGIGTSTGGLVFALGAVSWAPWDCAVDLRETCVPNIRYWPFRPPPYASDSCRSRCFPNYTIWYYGLAGATLLLGLLSFVHFVNIFCYGNYRQDTYKLADAQQASGSNSKVAYTRLKSDEESD